MKDQYGRTIDYLRISITDACNLRCRYCMPESAAGCALEQAEQNPPLTVEEMLKIVHAAAGLGITHYRITGGEPLVRKECVELVQKIKAVPGTASVGITTNGVRLASCARDLKAAGCDSRPNGSRCRRKPWHRREPERRKQKRRLREASPPKSGMNKPTCICARVEPLMK